MRKPGTPGVALPLLFMLAMLLIATCGGCASVCNRPGWDCKQVAPEAVGSAIVDSVRPWPVGGELVCVRAVYPSPFYAPTCWSVYHE
jgi:hypothetical protein